MAKYEKQLNTPNHTDYTSFDYLSNDMLFIREGVLLSPEVYEHADNDKDGKGTGVYKNMFIGFPDKNAMFDGFAKKFNDYLSNNTNWSVFRNGTDGGSRGDETDRRFDVLQFTGEVEGRLARDQENESTQYAYSDLSKIGEGDKEITYHYLLDTDKAVDKYQEVFQSKNPLKTMGKDLRDNKAINHQIATKFIASEVRKFLEIQKQDTQNRYYSKDWQHGNIMYTAFDDVNRPEDSSGIMFFVEGTNYIEGKIPSGRDKSIGNIVIGNYNIGAGGGQDTTDQLDPANTEVYFAQFDVVTVNAHEYNGQDWLDITIVIPEGIALSNTATIMQVNTLNKQDGASVELVNDKFDSSIYETYQIDGFIQHGLPNGFIARFEFISPQPYWKTAVNRTLSIVGNDLWLENQESIGQTKEGLKVDTNGKYQPKFPFYDGTLDSKALTDENRLIPADYLSRKYETDKVGSLNRVKYRTNKGINIKFNRYASALELTGFMPLSAVIQDRPRYGFVNVDDMFDNKKNKWSAVEHYVSVSMKPKTPLYANIWLGSNQDEMKRISFVDQKPALLQNTTWNPDIVIFNQGGKILDIQPTDGKLKSLLKENDYYYFVYDQTQLQSGTLYVKKDMPRIWFTFDNMDFNTKRDPSGDSGKWTNERNRFTGQTGLVNKKYQSDNTLEAATQFDTNLKVVYSVNGGAQKVVYPFNAPATLDNYLDLKAGDTVKIARTQTGGSGKVVQVRAITEDPTDIIYTNAYQPFLDYEFTIPFFWEYGTYDVRGEGTDGYPVDRLWLPAILPTRVNGKPTLWKGFNSDGSLNKVEVENNRFDLAQSPVNLGVVTRKVKYI